MSDKGRCPPTWDDGACLESIKPSAKGIYEVRASHTAAAVSATFDEPNLVSCAGLVPVLRLAEPNFRDLESEGGLLTWADAVDPGCAG